MICRLGANFARRQFSMISSLTSSQSLWMASLRPLSPKAARLAAGAGDVVVDQVFDAFLFAAGLGRLFGVGGDVPQGRQAEYLVFEAFAVAGIERPGAWMRADLQP